MQSNVQLWFDTTGLPKAVPTNLEQESNRPGFAKFGMQKKQLLLVRLRLEETKGYTTRRHNRSLWTLVQPKSAVLGQQHSEFSISNQPVMVWQ